MLSKIENQTIGTGNNKFRLDEQIRQSIVGLEPAWDKKEIEFDVEMDEVEFVGNENLFHHVWYNLIGNAIKFSPVGGVISIKLETLDNNVIFTVEDNGCGLSEEVQKHLFDKFYQDFPRVKSWMEDTQEFARKQGYVEDLWGRRRHLPDIQLPKFTVSLKDAGSDSTFNPLIGSKGIITRMKNPLVEKYENLCKKVRSKVDKDQLKLQAAAEGVSLQDNQGFIAEAERQSINARIQGGAASMSKKAMTSIYYDKEMRRLGFKLLIMVHDELIGECPIENQEAAMERLSYLMSEAGKPEVDLPMKCDVVAFSHWYLDEYTDMMCDKFDEMHKKGMTPSEIFESLLTEHPECTEEMLKDILKSRLE